jgi:hypothetical protein
VKYEARLEDGTVVSKSEGVEFTVKDGNPLFFSSIFTWPVEKLFRSLSLSLSLSLYIYIYIYIYILFTNKCIARVLLSCTGQSCQNHEKGREGAAYSKATM